MSGFSTLTNDDRRTVKNIKKKNPWISGSHAIEILEKCKNKPNTVCIAIEHKKTSHIYFGNKTEINEEVYAKEREELLKALDKRIGELRKNGTFSPDASIEIARIFVFSHNIVAWLGEMNKRAKTTGTAENVVHFMISNYWAAPQNSFRMMAELYIAEPDNKEVTKSDMDEQSLLTITGLKKSDVLIPDFYEIF